MNNEIMKKNIKLAYSSASGIVFDAIDMLKAVDKREAPNALMATDDLLYRACDKVRSKANNDPQLKRLVNKLTDQQSAVVGVYRKTLPSIADYLSKQAEKPWQEQVKRSDIYGY